MKAKKKEKETGNNSRCHQGLGAFPFCAFPSLFHPSNGHNNHTHPVGFSEVVGTVPKMSGHSRNVDY